MLSRDFLLTQRVGWVRLTSDGARVVSVAFIEPPAAPTSASCSVLDLAESALRGEIPVADVPMALPEPDTFAGRVVRELLKVPAGKVVTYLALARRADSPRAARAAGQVLARNPILVLVPCHRAVPTGGGLGGFSGGLERKRALLRSEGALPEPEPELFSAEPG